MEKRYRLTLLAGAMLALSMGAYGQKMTDQVIQQQRAEAMKTPFQVRQEKNEADYKKARSFLDAGNYKAAIPYLQAAAERDHLDSILELAMIYEDGKGVPLNMAKAQEYYVRVAERLPDITLKIKAAQLFCGGEGLYANDGVIRDPERGMAILAKEYSREWKVEMDWWKYVCYTRTASPDPKKAGQMLNEAASYLTGGDRDNTINDKAVKKVKDEIFNRVYAFRLYDRDGALKKYGAAAEAGDSTAQRALYEAYSDGRGAPQSRQLAFEWIMKAASAGDGFAQTVVGEAYLNGYTPVDRDYQAAIQWLTKGAEHGQWLAAWMLSDLYKKGLGGKPDSSRAQFWASRCNELGGKCGGQRQTVAPGAQGSAIQRAFQQ